MFCYRRKKFLPGCLIGLGLGIVLVLFLPLKAWLCSIGIGLVICGISKVERRMYFDYCCEKSTKTI